MYIYINIHIQYIYIYTPDPFIFLFINLFVHILYVTKRPGIYFQCISNQVFYVKRIFLCGKVNLSVVIKNRRVFNIADNKKNISGLERHLQYYSIIGYCNNFRNIKFWSNSTFLFSSFSSKFGCFIYDGGKKKKRLSFMNIFFASEPST